MRPPCSIAQRALRVIATSARRAFPRIGIVSLNTLVPGSLTIRRHYYLRGGSPTPTILVLDGPRFLIAFKEPKNTLNLYMFQSISGINWLAFSLCPTI